VRPHPRVDPHPAARARVRRQRLQPEVLGARRAPLRRRVRGRPGRAAAQGLQHALGGLAGGRGAPDPHPRRRVPLPPRLEGTGAAGSAAAAVRGRARRVPRRAGRGRGEHRPRPPARRRAHRPAPAHPVDLRRGGGGRADRPVPPRVQRRLVRLTPVRHPRPVPRRGRLRGGTTVSRKHPIISVTGSSGAGTTSVMRTFQQIFRREGVSAAFVEGDSFHRYDRTAMKAAMADAQARGDHSFSHFGPEANLFDELEDLFRTYGETGAGKVRRYLHDEAEAAPRGQQPGTFTPWESLPDDTDLLFYEGLHGAVVTVTVDVAQHADLRIGVVPVINLEWIQKLHRDKETRGYTAEAVTETILRRMPDYVNYVCPQFSHTDVNFQRVPVVDTSNPFIARTIPTADESLLIIRFRDPPAVHFPVLPTVPPRPV